MNILKYNWITKLSAESLIQKVPLNSLLALSQVYINCFYSPRVQTIIDMRFRVVWDCHVRIRTEGNIFIKTHFSVKLTYSFMGYNLIVYT